MSSSSASLAAETRPVPRSLRLQALVFLIVVVATMMTMEWLVRRRATNSYTKKRDMLVARAGDVRVIVTGPSSGYYGVDTSQFRVDAINLADVSQTLYYDDQILRAHLPRLKRLELVVFALGLPSYEFGLDGTAESYRRFWYSNFWGFPLEHDADRFDVRRFSLLALAPPSMRLGLLLGRDDSGASVDANGWYRPPATITGVSEDQAVKLVGYQAEMMSPPKGADNDRTLRSTLRTLRDRNVAAVLVWLPVHRFYLQHFDARARERAHAGFTRIANDLGAEFRDYSRDPRFEEGDFFDANHLNERGAAKFSRILDEDVVARIGAR